MINVDVYIAVRSKRKYIEKWCSLYVSVQQRTTFDGKDEDQRTENGFTFFHVSTQSVWKGNGGEMKKNRKEIFPVAVIMAHTRTHHSHTRCIVGGILCEYTVFPCCLIYSK